MVDETRDARLAEVLDEMLFLGLRGELSDPEPMFREHADLQPELRELWATMILAEDCASSDNGRMPTMIPESNADDGAAQAASIPTALADYELLEEIGRGGMGVVFKARQKSLDRVVALKMVLRGDFATEVELQRFQAEAEAAGRLNHPNIVPVYEVGETEGRPFFSMRFVEGTTLARRLVEGPLPAREAAELLVPVCRAVAEAHRRGVLHRDLKPSNILIGADGRPYVSDFGLAKRIVPPAESATGTSNEPSLTQSGAIVGTPGYMAPEQAAGRRGDVGVATDVYSLGALLYATITGRAPFQAASPVDTVLMVLEQEPLPPRLLNPRCDPDLEMIALKCLQKPTDLRYASADDLADDLQAYLNGEPISARSSRFTEVLIRAFRETHHAPVLENWGVLWMWHSLVLLVMCLLTNFFQLQGVESRLPYVGLWTVASGAWAAIFWQLRRRSGPITFVERQIAHIWAGSMISVALLFGVEALLGLPVLRLSPVLGLITGMVFLAKAGILTGRFYIQAIALFACSGLMALMQHTKPDLGITLFGVVSAASFFFPGLHYYRQSRNNE